MAIYKWFIGSVQWLRFLVEHICPICSPGAFPNLVLYCIYINAMGSFWFVSHILMKGLPRSEIYKSTWFVQGWNHNILAKLLSVYNEPTSDIELYTYVNCSAFTCLQPAGVGCSWFWASLLHHVHRDGDINDHSARPALETVSLPAHHHISKVCDELSHR